LLNNAPEIMEGLVNRMRYMSSYLVVDLGAGLNALNQRLYGICNTLLVLVEPVKNSIMHTRTFINELGDLPVNMDQIHAVMVNRIRSDTQINMAQLEELLGMTPIIAITPAPELVYEANHSKTTMFSTRPNSLTAQQFSKLAGALLEFEKQIKK
jgi:MinD-like ATPase involved in chromosome partitioning or flagellar assembly